MSYQKGLLIEEKSEKKFMIHRYASYGSVFIYETNDGRFRCCNFDHHGNYTEVWTLKVLYNFEGEYRLERKFIYYNSVQKGFIEVDLEKSETKQWVFPNGLNEIENNYILKQQADYLRQNKS